MRAHGAGDLPEGIEGGLDAQICYNPENLTYPYGAYFCVVDVDPGTGVVKVRRFLAVDDCGTRINPMIIEGQVHGGLVDGIGMALMEMIAFDEEGNCLGGSFMDYLIPTAMEVPHFETGPHRHAVTAPSDRGQGHRGVGNRRFAAGGGQRRGGCVGAVRRSSRGHAAHTVAGVGGDAGQGEATDLTTISERAQQLRRSRTPFVHATVVRAAQPTSAHPGDEAILLADGTIEGFVGGQCAQNSVRTAAMGALKGGESVLLRVLPDGDVHFPDAPGACVVVNPCLSGGALEIFLVPEMPAPLVRICGQTPIAEALAQLCAGVGYDVSTDGDDLSGTTAVVIASHGGPEAETIRAAIDAGVGYIGMVASRVRGAAIVDGLGLDEAERARVHTPVGLPIGARTPAEIAVSILAEVIAAIRVGGLAVAQRDDRIRNAGRRSGLRNAGHGRPDDAAPATRGPRLLVLR